MGNSDVAPQTLTNPRKVNKDGCQIRASTIEPQISKKMNPNLRSAIRGFDRIRSH